MAYSRGVLLLKLGLAALFAFLLLTSSFPAGALAEGIEDTEPPQLQSLSIEPTEIDTSAEARTVTLTAHVTDNLAGVTTPSVVFNSPGGQFTTGGLSLISGTPTDGIYRGPVTFKRFSETGTWKLSQMFIEDQLGNRLILTDTMLQERGLPNAVEVQEIAVSPPTINIVSPESGPEAGGTEVQIGGTDLSGATAVRFGESFAGFTINSPTSITAIAPPGTGTVDITVTTRSGTSTATPLDRFRYSPEVSLASSPNPSARGTQITFVAQGKSSTPEAPIPTGSVSFVEGSTTLATIPLSGGSATYKTPSLNSGHHLIRAIYSGDGYFGPSESSPVDQVVERIPTQVELTSSKNPATFGSSGNLTATVEGKAPGAGKPTGSVTFKEGTTVIAVVPLSGKSAKLPLKSLSPGVHQIGATYSGDGNFESSASQILSQTILP